MSFNPHPVIPGSKYCQHLHLKNDGSERVRVCPEPAGLQRQGWTGLTGHVPSPGPGWTLGRSQDLNGHLSRQNLLPSCSLSPSDGRQAVIRELTDQGCSWSAVLGLGRRDGSRQREQWRGWGRLSREAGDRQTAAVDRQSESGS